MKWITRERPKIDRIACPWLIKNFVDKEAEFIYVPKETVFEKAKALNAIPFDLPGAEYTDTDSFELAPQAAGLWAISAGLSFNYKDDHEMLAIGMKLYDALYSWAKYVQHERHTWSPA
jgi:hypothetical protein